MMIKFANLIKKPTAATLLSILFGFIVGAIVLMIAGYSPIEAYESLFHGVFSRPKYVAQTIITATPVIITGLSVAFAFKTGLFNIGAEGQFMMGSIMAAFIGYKLALPGIIHPIVVIIAAMAAGAVWGGIVGILKAKFGIHEVISSIMLNWIALYANNYYITLPSIKKPNTEASYEVLQSSFINVLYKFKTSPEGLAFFKEHKNLADVFLKTDINYGIVIAIIAAVVVWYILNKTTLGYSLRAVGFNKDAAEFAGINVKRNILVSMIISGAIAGLAGAVYITGMSPHRITVLSAHEGFGFNGLSVALIANSNPYACIPAGLLFGALKYGGGTIQSDIGAPSEIINIMIGTIVFFIGMSNLFTIISDLLKKRGGKNA